MKRLGRVFVVFVCVICMGVFCGCTGSSGLEDKLNSQEKDIASLQATIATLQGTIERLEDTMDDLKDILNDSALGNAALAGKIEEMGKELAQAKTDLLFMQGAAESDVNRIYKLGETVSFAANGVKLFEVTVKTITRDEFGIYVRYTFLALNIETTGNITDIINAQLRDPNDKYYRNVNENEFTDPIYRYVFSSSILGKQRLYLGIQNKTANCAFIPFACYEFEVTA